LLTSSPGPKFPVTFAWQTVHIVGLGFDAGDTALLQTTPTAVASNAPWNSHGL
jgi:hypothetical protein